jgi:putative ABC transport system permease protein
MTRHLLKLVWNRKRSNVLIAVEILLSFIVLVGVTTLAVFYVDNYRRPLGYDVENIWTISFEKHTSGRSSVTIESGPEDAAVPRTPVDRGWVGQRARIAQLMMALRDMPEVESVAAAFVTPYSSTTINSDIEVDGRHHRYGLNAATDDFARTMGLEVTRGRWFSREDDGAAWTPVVLNDRLAREVFPDKDPIGRFVDEQRPGDSPGPRMRVVGVIREFRKDGEYAAPENFLFNRNRLDDPDVEVQPPNEIVIRVKAGTTAAFEEKAVTRLRDAEPEWTFQAEPLAQSRETSHRLWLAPLSAAAIISVFLLVMVAMGLTGVLWLHVTQRTREIGLRRAKGATIVNIQRQLVGEVAVLTSIACLVGVAIIVQFPLLDVFSVLSPMVYGISVAISLVCIFLLSMACAWVPSRLASAIQPAEALRYE